MTSKSQLVEIVKLNPSESSRLSDCEKIISNGKKTFEAVGQALAEIRDSKLYRQSYHTFEHYLKEKWGWSKSRGYQLIAASSINVQHVRRFDLTARGATELAKIPVEQRPAVLKSAAKDGKATAEAIRKIVRLPIRSTAQAAKPDANHTGVFDKTGLEVPKESVELWNSGTAKGENSIHELHSQLRRIRNVLRDFDKNEPVPFDAILLVEIKKTIQQDLAHLSQVIADMECAIPYAVCWTCNGKVPKGCATCNGRGFVSEFFFKHSCPPEIKILRGCK